MTARPSWLPDLVIGLLVAVFGFWEVTRRHLNSFEPLWEFFPLFAVALLFAAAAGLYRLAPGAALALVWITCVGQVLSGLDVLYTQMAVAVVAFGCARWGSTATVWLSALSMPVGAFLAFAFVANGGNYLSKALIYDLITLTRAAGFDATRGVLASIGFGFLAVPWLVGLVFRIQEQARLSRQHEIEAVESKRQAEEIAALRAEQARLAHDVHDVVGHSLAVILAQAESAQFLPDDDPERMKATMANIADSARQSLRDVRQVLNGNQDAQATQPGLDELIESVRDAGNDLRSTVVGTPRPLPPEIETVAYRTLQEMLTNAIKHGVRGEPVTVLRHWAQELTIAVENKSSSPAPGEGGLGLAGMRMRLESIGGRLDVRHHDGTFTATAWLPLRHGMMSR